VAATGPVSNLISRENSAWAIAGEEYNSRTTVYVLPNGHKLTGDRIQDAVGWHLLPVNTRVLLNQVTEKQAVVEPVSPVKVITDRMTAWSHAGPAYGYDSTIYFLPSGTVYPGSRISDWDDLPRNTRLIVGYQGPYFITSEKTAYKIAGQRYKDRASGLCQNRRGYHGFRRSAGRFPDLSAPGQPALREPRGRLIVVKILLHLLRSAFF